MIRNRLQPGWTDLSHRTEPMNQAHQPEPLSLTRKGARAADQRIILNDDEESGLATRGLGSRRFAPPPSAASDELQKASTDRDEEAPDLTRRRDPESTADAARDQLVERRTTCATQDTVRSRGLWNRGLA